MGTGSIWVTSDHHFFHKNIMKYCPEYRSRFESVEEMNDIMIQRWNKKVQENDIIYHLGDFSFGNLYNALDVIDQLKGIKYFIPGNHDNNLRKHPKFREKWDHFAGSGTMDIHYKGVDIRLNHYPRNNNWRGFDEGWLWLHGHCHGSNPPHNFPMMDVGVDCNELYPFLLDDVIDILRSK